MPPKKLSKKGVVQDILVLHQNKLDEFTKEGVEKGTKALKSKLLKINPKDSVLDRKDKEKKNKVIQEEIEYLQSGQKEMDYLSDTYTLINRYTKLEEEILELLKLGFTNEVYILNKEKIAVSKEYFKLTIPDFIDDNIGKDLGNHFCTNQACSQNLLEANDGFYVCHKCGYCQLDIQISEDLGFKETQEREYKTQFTYQKETHLEDWLKRFQAKENKTIPSEIIDKVILEAHKQRITDLSTLTEIQVKRYLKKLKLNDYYDNVINIINRINKRPPFLLTSEIETKIKEMFKQIQEPFQKYKDPTRKNMLSYSYLLHHFFLILGLPEFSKYFFLLKSPDKLRQQDQTFKKIVDHLASKDPNTNWIFHPSI